MTSSFDPSRGAFRLRPSQSGGQIVLGLVRTSPALSRRLDDAKSQASMLTGRDDWPRKEVARMRRRDLLVSEGGGLVDIVTLPEVPQAF
jgi:hypothetical protein